MDYASWNARRCRNSRVFILGAGFSADAGVPVAAKMLPLVMKTFASECPGLYERIDRFSKRLAENAGGGKVDWADPKFFPELRTDLAYLELSGHAAAGRCGEKLAPRFYIAKIILKHTYEHIKIPDIYPNFADQLHEGDLVVTFNWDTVLELAILEVGKRFTYNGTTNGPIRLCKLHGSTNWRVGTHECNGQPVNSLGWESLDYAGEGNPAEIYHTPALLEPDAWDLFQPLEEVQPFLVLLGFGKEYDVRMNAWNWCQPNPLFERNHDVFIVGFGMASDDFLIRRLLHVNLPSLRSYSGPDDRMIYIIDPDEEGCRSTYDFLLSKGRAQLLPEYFSSDHVELMKASRAGWDNSLNGDACPV